MPASFTVISRSRRCECRMPTPARARLARAVRPSAASAPSSVRGALWGRASSTSEASACKEPEVLFQHWWPGPHVHFRRSACMVGIGGLSVGHTLRSPTWPVRQAAHAGRGALASNSTQRTIRAGPVPLGVRSNLSIEATATGVQRSGAFASAVPPVSAPHLTR
jgi:hypothetical protein